MMDFKVTIESTRNSLYHSELRCINDLCRSESIVVTCQPGSSAELTRETYECRSCQTRWTAEMFAARVNEIYGPNGEFYDDNCTSHTYVEDGVFKQIGTPRGPIKKALEEFLQAMKMGSTTRKGEALAKLAFMARVEL